MTYNVNDILDAYHAIGKADRPEITEEFSNAMAEREAALNKLEIRNESDPSKKIGAFNEVVKNEGANIMSRSSVSLAILVSEVLRTKETLCA